MAAASEDDIDDWIRAINQLHNEETRDPSDARAAQEAVANLWSGFGYQDAPLNVTYMLINAIEAGYATALRDVREGKFDDDIREWRPDLNDD